MSNRDEDPEDEAPDRWSMRQQVTSWQDRLPDPRAILAAFQRNIWVFLAAFLLVVGAVAVRFMMQAPIYAATSSVLVQPRSETVVNIQSVAPDLSPTTDVVDTEVRLVKSPSVARRVTDAFIAKYPSSRPANGEGRAKLAANLLSTVSAARVGSTYVIEITSRARDAEQATVIANLFAEEVVAANRDAKRGANSNASDWLNSRMATLELEATNAEAALQEYKIRNNLISANGATLAEQQISSLGQEIAQAEANLAEKQGRLAAARAQLQVGGGGADVGAALGSGTIGTLRSREAQISAEVAKLGSQFGPLYPPLKTARQELLDVQQQIQFEIDRILSNLQADVRVASSRLSSLRGSRGQATQVLQTSNSAAVGLTELQRRSDAANDVYQTFLNRLRETTAQEGLQQADLRVAELADVPSFPESPRVNVTLMLGLIGGLVMGVISVGAAEYLSGGLSSKSDVENRLRTRYAGAIPLLESTLENIRPTEPPHQYVVSHPLSMFAEAFRSIRAFLLLGGGATSKSRTVAITSPLPKEGKTTTAICLARSAAMSGSATVLVDCDLRRRGVSEIMRYRDGPDLHNYLAGTAKLDDVLQEDTETGLFILGVANMNTEDHDPLSPEAVQKLIDELRERFKIIIFDTAPVLGVADARVVAAAVDRVLVITKWKDTPIRASEAAIELLLDAGAKISGLSLSLVDIRKYKFSGYAEGLGYGKKFRGYYVD